MTVPGMGASNTCATSTAMKNHALLKRGIEAALLRRVASISVGPP
jgi:hypothetical protein